MKSFIIAVCRIRYRVQGRGGMIGMKDAAFTCNMKCRSLPCSMLSCGLWLTISISTIRSVYLP